MWWKWILVSGWPIKLRKLHFEPKHDGFVRVSSYLKMKNQVFWNFEFFPPQKIWFMNGIEANLWIDPSQFFSILANMTTVNVTSFQLRIWRNDVQKSGSAEQPTWALARGKRAAGAKILLFWDPKWRFCKGKRPKSGSKSGQNPDPDWPPLV